MCTGLPPTSGATRVEDFDQGVIRPQRNASSPPSCTPVRRRAACAAAAALLAACVPLPSCAPLGRYARARALDLSDVVDLKYGTGLGLGAKIELIMYFGVGLGISSQTYWREWFGRKAVESRNGFFLCWLVSGGEGDFIHGSPPASSVTVFGFDALLIDEDFGRDVGPSDCPGLLARWRFGAEVLVPFAQGGVYLNLGELADFVLGLATLDPACDDDISKGALIDPSIARPLPAPGTAPASPPATTDDAPAAGAADS